MGARSASRCKFFMATGLASAGMRLLVVLATLWSMHAHASFPAADTTPVDPLSWTTIKDPYAGQGVGSSPSAACALLTPNNGYTFTGAVKSGAQWLCTGTGNGHNPAVGFPNLPVNAKCPDGANIDPSIDKCVPLACPQTAALSSSMCTCKAGFRENASHNGCDARQTSRAFFTFGGGTSGVLPSYWETVHDPYAGYFQGPTPNSACAQLIANHGYTFTGAVKSTSGWLCTGTGNGHDPSVGFSNLPVTPKCPTGTTYDLTSDQCFAVPQCPANATYDAASKTCGCPLGYQMARNGTACEAAPLPPGAAYGSQNSCPREDGTKEGGPILPGTGAKEKVQIDYVDPAGRGPDVVRTYLSNVRDAVVPMGIGWRLSLLHVLASTSTKAVITLGDGYIITFTRANTSSPWAAVGSADTLTISGSQWRIKDSRNDDVYLFEPAGTGTDYAKSVTQRNGWVTTYTYTNGQLTQVVNPFGRSLSLAYAPTGLLQSITAPDGQLIQYAYDTGNRLSSVTYADGGIRGYVYENPASLDALTGIVDERGNRYATYTYDSQERAVTTELAGGVAKYAIVYGSGAQASVTDPLGTVRTYTYATASGRQTVSAADKPSPNGTADAASRTQDSATGLVLSETDFLGGVTTFQWFAPRMLPASVTQAYGTPLARTKSTTWHSTLSLPLTVAEPGRTTAWTYDAVGNPLTRVVTDTATGQTRTWSWTYNVQQLVATSSTPEQGTTTYTWDTAGRLTKEANALNQETHYDYDTAGRLSQQTDANGLVTTYAYDARGRRTNVTTGTESTTYAWDAAGLLQSVTLPDGAIWSFTYDDAQRLTQVQDGLGNKVVYTLDAMGNRLKEEAKDASDAVIRTRSWAYTSLNRLQDAIDGVAPPAQATTTTYDLNANPIGTSAPLGRNSSRTFDVLNRVKQVTDANSGVTKFEYDAQDNLTKVTDPKNLNTAYAYNGFGQLLTQSSPDTGTTTFVYNANGTLQGKTDARGVATGYTWDALGRVATITYPDQTITYTYDACTNGVGRVCSVTDGTVSTSYTYTQAGRVASKTQVVGTATLTVGYAYNSAGELSQVTTPAGSVVGYSYANGRVTGITAAPAGAGTVNLLSQIAYNADGQVQGWQWSDGTARTITYDDAGRIASFSLGNPAGTGSKAGVVRQLQRDAAGRITGYTHSNSAGAVTAMDQGFGYDSLDRLVTATWATGSIGYSYDANGNRTAKTVGGTTYANTVDSQSNKLLSVAHASGTSAVSHDAAGNVTGDGTFTYAYGGRGRMNTASPGGLSFAYDWLGQRVRKQSTGGAPTSTYYVYDEAGRLIGEYDASGTPTYETVYLNGAPVGVLKQSAAYNVYADQIDTPRMITAQDQTIVWRWDAAEAFGATAPNQNPNSLGVFTFNQRFPGQMFDAETGLNQNWHREYRAAWGRYIQSDPIGLSGGINTYGYVRGKPLSSIDRAGLQAEPWERRSGPISVPDISGQYQRELARRLTRIFDNIVEACKGLGGRIFSTPEEEEKPNLVDPKGEQHILDGDETGGGHRAGTGKPGKSEFPPDWSDERVLGEISDVATDPASSRSPGRNGREQVRGTRGGVDIEVIVGPDGRIITGYPTNSPRNPR